MADHFAASEIKVRTACGRDYRDLMGGQKSITLDRAAVTCRSCQRSGIYRYPSMVLCGIDYEHAPRAAVAALSWPDGRFKPTTACVSCLRQHVLMSVDGTHGEVHPVLVSPLAKQGQP